MRYNAIEKRIETSDRNSTNIDRERQVMMNNDIGMITERRSEEKGVYANTKYWSLVIVAVSIDMTINRCLFDQIHTNSGF